MRKLGRGQSVTFAAPPEIDTEIRAASPTPLQTGDAVNALDVLRWAMLKTCNDLEHHVSHWAQQGIDYARRSNAQRRWKKQRDVSILEEGWVTPEARTLEEMYGVLSPTDASRDRSLTQLAFDVPNIRDRLQFLGIQKLKDPSMDEEQEREVSHEVERELRVERPSKQEPAPHGVHPDVRYFIEKGSIPAQSSAFIPLFNSLCPFGPGTPYEWPKQLLASVDFSCSVVNPAANQQGDYMRPVNWIVKGINGIRAVLSPYEVNELLPVIRRSTLISLHVYAPRVSESMRSFSDLSFYSVPPQFDSQTPSSRSIIQIYFDIFAGQLYLSDYNEYVMLCALLGLSQISNVFRDHAAPPSDSDGFVKPENRRELFLCHPGYAACRFTSSQIPMLRDLFGRRRKGMNYLLTHMGQLLHGQHLTQSDF